MSKEMVISAGSHETRVAIMEDGLLCEIYVEREREFALVGSIYKGKVTRVLPGMQSAFVEIGLDSDAFLYVSDFLEDIEDFEPIVTTIDNRLSGQVDKRVDKRVEESLKDRLSVIERAIADLGREIKELQEHFSKDAKKKEG